MCVIGNFACASEKVVGGLLFNVSQDQFELWEKVVRTVSLWLKSYYSTSAWIEEVMVRRLRLGPAFLLPYLL